MSNKQMIVYKEGFIYKIKRFFLNLFGKKENKEIKEIKEESSIDIIESNDSVIEKESLKDKFMEEIRVDTTETDKIIARNAFLDKIDGNEEELGNLSLEDLFKVFNYYDEVINENEEEIKKLNVTA